MGVTVTFVAILELMREGLIDIVQTEAYAPLHVRAARPHPQLRVVGREEWPRRRRARPWRGRDGGSGGSGGSG